MKKIFFFSILCLLPILVLADGINFEHITVNEAIKKAKVENKLVFIDGWATWCGPCKHMAATVFLEDEVGAIFDKNFVALKIDVERGEGPEVKRKYGITGLPGYVFIDGDGTVVYRFEASMPKQKFIDHVNKAIAYSKDPQSAGRLAELYPKKKNDESFVRLYLEKLKESKSTGYVDVLNHYLQIQKTMKEDSKEMVYFLADHAEEIAYGTVGDSIIHRNLGSDAWKLWVRKDIREIYQQIPRKMLEATTNYAIDKKDTAYIELALSRASEAGVNVNEQQTKNAYTYFYNKTENGEKYKSIVYQDNVNYINSLDTATLRSVYLDWQVKCANGDKQALAMHPHAIKISNIIQNMVYEYSRFVVTPKEKQDVIKWMYIAYYILPNDPVIMNQYANVLYKFGNDKAKAININEKAYEIAKSGDSKKATGIGIDLDQMRKGEEIILK